MIDLSRGSSEHGATMNSSSIGRVDGGLLAKLIDVAVSTSTGLSLTSVRQKGESYFDSEKRADFFDRLDLMLRANSSSSVSSAVAFSEVDADDFNCVDVSDCPRPLVTLISKSVSAASSVVASVEIDADLRLQAMGKR